MKKIDIRENPHYYLREIKTLTYTAIEIKNNDFKNIDILSSKIKEFIYSCNELKKEYAIAVKTHNEYSKTKEFKQKTALFYKEIKKITGGYNARINDNEKELYFITPIHYISSDYFNHIYSSVSYGIYNMYISLLAKMNFDDKSALLVTSEKNIDFYILEQIDKKELSRSHLFIDNADVITEKELKFYFIYLKSALLGVLNKLKTYIRTNYISDFESNTKALELYPRCEQVINCIKTNPNVTIKEISKETNRSIDSIRKILPECCIKVYRANPSEKSLGIKKLKELIHRDIV